VLTSTTCTNPASQGSNCGAQTQLLTLAQLPTGITSANASQNITETFNNQIAASLVGAVVGNNTITPSGTINVPVSNAAWGGITTVTTANSISVTSNNTSGAAHPILPPVALVDKYIKF